MDNEALQLETRLDETSTESIETGAEVYIAKFNVPPALIEGRYPTNPDFAEPHHAEGSMDRPGIGYPLQLAKDVLPIRDDVADKWVEHFADKDKEVGWYYMESELEIFNNPKYAPIVDGLNLYFLPMDRVLFDRILQIMQYDHPFEVPEQTQILLRDLKSVISLFPELEKRLGLAPRSSGLLKLPEVARMLSISESKLRKLTMEGAIESTKSQGETGHYRYKPEWVRKFAESRNDG